MRATTTTMPDSRKQVRWGLVLAALLILAVGIMAFVPDPLHPKRFVVVGLDQVEGIGEGVPVYFRGDKIGAVRHIRLVPDELKFDVELALRGDWRGSACSFVTVDAANPLAQPHLELVALDRTAAQCPAARAAASCDQIIPKYGGRDWLPGCKRSPDLIALATVAVRQAADVAQSAGQITSQLKTMVMGPGGAGGVGTDMKASVKDLSAILASLNRSMTPGHGDVAQTLANVRLLSGQASRLDVASINATLGSVRTMVAENRAAIGQIASNGAAATGEASALLQSSQRSLNETSANLARASVSIDALLERMSADPTFAIRGQKFADPPPVPSR